MGFRYRGTPKQSLSGTPCTVDGIIYFTVRRRTIVLYSLSCIVLGNIDYIIQHEETTVLL